MPLTRFFNVSVADHKPTTVDLSIVVSLFDEVGTLQSPRRRASGAGRPRQTWPLFCVAVAADGVTRSSSGMPSYYEEFCATTFSDRVSLARAPHGLAVARRTTGLKMPSFQRFSHGSDARLSQSWLCQGLARPMDRTGPSELRALLSTSEGGRRHSSIVASANSTSSRCQLQTGVEAPRRGRFAQLECAQTRPLEHSCCLNQSAATSCTRRFRSRRRRSRLRIAGDVGLSPLPAARIERHSPATERFRRHAGLVGTR